MIWINSILVTILLLAIYNPILTLSLVLIYFLFYVFYYIINIIINIEDIIFNDKVKRVLRKILLNKENLNG